MEVLKTKLEGVLVLKPELFLDDRGSYMNSYDSDSFAKLNLAEFVQDSITESKKGVVRGLHFQLPPSDRAKLVSVFSGSVIDVVVDLRKSSPTYGKWESFILKSNEPAQLFIPAGFAHGFVALEDHTKIHYKFAKAYRPDSQCGIVWNDSTIGINWQLEKLDLKESELILSDKDKNLTSFEEFDKTNPF